MNFNSILSRFGDVKQVGPDQYEALCPCHDDKHASLSIHINPDGRILLHCQAGCDTRDILSRVGLTMADLFPNSSADSPNAPVAPRKVVATYPYYTLDGKLLATKLRYDPKGFAWSQKQPDGSVIFKKPAFLPPYNILAAQKSDVVVLVEGEKDVDTLTKIGIVAVSLPSGAMGGTWPQEYTPYFVGKQVYIIPDNDDVGKAYAQAAAASIEAVAKSAQVVNLAVYWPTIPPKGDVTDYVETNGKTAVETLQKLLVLKAQSSVIIGTKDEYLKKINVLDPYNNERYSRNDNGSGRLFADLVKENARYVPERKKWFVFNGVCWELDEGNMRVMEMCKAVGDALNQYALSIRDEADRKEYLKYTGRWLIRNGRTTILSDAASVYTIKMSEFDSDIFLLNCRNGTLDLRTLQFRTHDPNDKLTKVADVEYDPTATCQRFEQFLSEVMSGDRGKQAFLQKVLGYALSGETRYECMFILFGASTRNGKSTLMESVLRVLGDYARTTRPETIAAKNYNNSSGPSEDIARLAGIRMANISEPAHGLRLNTAQVKALTGNDSINARYLHENSFDFRPQAKMYINTNYLPQVDDVTLFASNRIYVIPFDRHFAAAEQDPLLKEKFATEQAKSAILNWLLAGYTMLNREGLNPPAAITDCTAEYKHESDKVSLFAEDKLVTGNGYEERTANIYNHYKLWCECNGYMAENASNFNKALRTIGKVVRKRPALGGSPTTFLLGYKIK